MSIRGTQRYSMSGRGKNGDVFNLLLGLYKLNPLRSSKVYKSFSEHVLSGHYEKKNHDVMHFDSNESAKRRVKIDLNEIEKVIHGKSNRSNKAIRKPEYSVDSVDIENFTVNIVMNNRINERFNLNHDDNIDIYSSIFGLMNSNEIEDEIPVTKLLPVNDSIAETSNPSNRILNEVTSKYLEVNKAVDNIGTVVEYRNEIQDRGVMSDKLDTGDVIVL